MKAPLPPDEELRLNELRNYHILDSAPEQEFDDITLLASRLCGTPIALISLIDENRQWFKSKVGMMARESTRDISFCAHGILQSGVFVVEDARADERFADNPLVTGGPELRFYAGSPLITPGGRALGTLCVADIVPRRLNLDERQALQALSRQVVTQLELRRNVAQLRLTEKSLDERNLLGALDADVRAVLARHETLADMLRSYCEAIVHRLDGAFARIWVLNESAQVLELQASAGLYTHLDGAHGRVPVGKFKIGLIAQERKPHLTNQVVGDPRVGDQEWAKREGMVAFAGYPLLVEDCLVGVVAMFARHPLTDLALTAMSVLAGNIAAGIERKRWETELLESKRFLRSTLDALSSHIAILDENGKIIEVNAAWVRFASQNGFRGQTAGVGDNYLGVCSSTAGRFTEGASAVADGIRSVMTGVRDEFHLEYPCHGPQEQRWFIVRATRFGGPGPVRVVVAHENITDRIKAEQSARDSEQKFHQLADNISDVFWIASPDLNTIYFVSAGYELVWGHPTGTLYALPHQRFESILAEDREHVLAVFGTLMKDARQVSVEYRIARPDGAIRWVHDRGFQVRDAAGQLVRVTGIATDITGRKQLETQLFQSQKLETVGKLAGGIAHEFNSILAAILGQSELLLKELPAHSLLAENVNEISHAANRAATLTRQLLAYARKQLFQAEIIDLNEVIAGMKDVFQHLMGGAVQTRIFPAAGLKLVRSDAGQIEQVIMNLAMNARDAMPDGGKFTLETANVSVDAEAAGRHPDLTPGDYVMLSVTDTGAGMSPDVKTRAFEPFFSTKGVGRGTGLGLSTCYGIIKQSGGHITVFSEPGWGATFKIYLPQYEPQTKAAVSIPPPSNLPRGTETVLVVLKDLALREIVETLLKRLGYAVLTAGSAIEALNVTQRRELEAFDLLVVDLDMEPMSGWELAEKVVALRPRTRVLFTSDHTEPAAVYLGRWKKGHRHLQKPFAPAALAHKLREALD
jgi:PAS domain S-box-containing protein